MTPEEVRDYFGSTYAFEKKTGMAHVTLMNWLKWGYVPELAQLKLVILTNGKLEPSFDRLKSKKKGKK